MNNERKKQKCSKMLEKLQPKEHKNVTATKALKNFKNCNKSQQNLQLQNELQDIPPPQEKTAKTTL